MSGERILASPRCSVSDTSRNSTAGSALLPAPAECAAMAYWLEVIQTRTLMRLPQATARLVMLMMRFASLMSSMRIWDM